MFAFVNDSDGPRHGFPSDPSTSNNSSTSGPLPVRNPADSQAGLEAEAAADRIGAILPLDLAAEHGLAMVMARMARFHPRRGDQYFARYGASGITTAWGPAPRTSSAKVASLLPAASKRADSTPTGSGGGSAGMRSAKAAGMHVGLYWMDYQSGNTCTGFNRVLALQSFNGRSVDVGVPTPTNPLAKEAEEARIACSIRRFGRSGMALRMTRGGAKDILGRSHPAGILRLP